ncbi:hypothetical protein ACFQ6B_23855 [Streptomyces wedmorensis]|uniref:Uncharacterized protein n=1 Tax=Streptomyces wedmorensis TaxID=43759 RepID=A0ABW6J6H9_STRWE
MFALSPAMPLTLQAEAEEEVAARTDEASRDTLPEPTDRRPE